MANTETAVNGPRPIHTIAEEIKQEWRKVYFGAVPYLDAMMSLRGSSDMYGCDSAHEIVLRFLGNAATFRGDRAKALKSELKSHFSGKR